VTGCSREMFEKRTFFIIIEAERWDVGSHACAGKFSEGGPNELRRLAFTDLAAKIEVSGFFRLRDGTVGCGPDFISGGERCVGVEFVVGAPSVFELFSEEASCGVF